MTPSKEVQPTSTEKLLSKLRQENLLLKARLEEARDTIAGYRTKLDAHSTATYQHSRLMRLLEALSIPLPECDDEYVSPTYIARAKQAIATPANLKLVETQRDVMIAALKHLLGARDVQIVKKDGGGSEYQIRLLLRDDELEREMEFGISWDHEKIEYNRISMNLPGADLPQFADEESIWFDIPQGPFFLAEVLRAVHDVRVGDDGREGDDARDNDNVHRGDDVNIGDDNL